MDIYVRARLRFLTRAFISLVENRSSGFARAIHIFAREYDVREYAQRRGPSCIVSSRRAYLHAKSRVNQKRDKYS